MRSTYKATLLLSARALLVSGQSCPDIYIFGARETTASAGFGSAGAMIDMIIADHSGATSEAIDYPACGGQSSCGSVSYADSAKAGTSAVATAVNDFNTRCPDSQIVLVGYSQGGQIMDNALCGGGDSGAGITDTAVPISDSAVKMIKAAILMGDPRYVSGLAYGVGTCTSGGFDARASGFTCPSASKVQLYCDGEDPYCCDGSDAAHHQQYVSLYGDEALTFVNNKLSATTDTTTDDDATTVDDTTTAVATNTVVEPKTTLITSQVATSQTAVTGGSDTACAALWGQCGGQQWTGATCCSSGTCQAFNDYYSQCLN
ncbi:cutinase-domain-containing protein [Dactylonectria macrodidyma]|uniref:Cutinase-domain-containing protein n=1 Tax=Dactylonectria macrodidyma TaxID=307937 RepID=A0A9P9F3W0_9HYPO|nr:cutinase-domain-containing protein [Dactylonectria macrodidyma]